MSLRNAALVMVLFWSAIAAGQEAAREKLDATARTAITRVPLPWRVTQSDQIVRDQTEAIAAKLGGEIAALSNAKLSAFGGTVQVNTIKCASLAHAHAIGLALAKIHSDEPDRVLRHDATVIELVGPSIDLCRRATYELGLRPMPKTFRWHVSFDAAPVADCRDPMHWNPLYEACLRLRTGDQAADAEVARLSRSFVFGQEIAVGGPGTLFHVTPSALQTFDESPNTRFVLGQLPTIAEIPTAHVVGTVSFPPPKPDVAPPGPALTATTPFWPADDPEVVALVMRITSGRTGPAEQVEAILEWLVPGRHVRYAGPVGSRVGVNACLKAREGRCWDFADLFITLCRARGIPARQKIGWLYGADGHVWAEVYLPEDGWTPFDATGGPKLECGPFHIPWSTSDDGRVSFVYTSKPSLRLETR